jgi:hypothetical protein
MLILTELTEFFRQEDRICRILQEKRGCIGGIRMEKGCAK